MVNIVITSTGVCTAGDLRTPHHDFCSKSCSLKIQTVREEIVIKMRSTSAFQVLKSIAGEGRLLKQELLVQTMEYNRYPISTFICGTYFLSLFSSFYP